MAGLPPLGALRAFEAAARHLSFTKAGEELFVTQAAISHQIKALEDHLGVPLFRRLNRALLLTDQGQMLLPFVREAFDSLTAGVRRVIASSGSGVLRISSTPSFAANWLAARLGRFHAAHPGIELQLGATLRLVDYVRDGIDCGIRYGNGNWPGLRAERLFRTRLLPVCHPSLLAGPLPLREPADLAHHTLLHALDDLDDWRLWLQAAGVKGIDPLRGPKFETLELAVQAAAGGAGVAIGRRYFVEPAIAAGTLVAPFAVELPDEAGYYFVAPESSAEQPKIRAFRDWLLQEVARQAAELDG
jgi:LysR family glycine cleavage system transcriptional activator